MVFSTTTLKASFVGKGSQIISGYLILSSFLSCDFAFVVSHLWLNPCIMPMSIMVYLRIHRRVFSTFALSKTLGFSFFQKLTPETFMWIEPETSILYTFNTEIYENKSLRAILKSYVLLQKKKKSFQEKRHQTSGETEKLKRFNRSKALRTCSRHNKWSK